MFDSETQRIIQDATPLDGLDLERLPQFLTEAYAKVTAARLGAVQLSREQKEQEWIDIVVELRRLAETYEALAIFLPADSPHRASCAFVAGSAHHTLSQARLLAARANGEDGAAPSLTASAVSSEVAACLLFLIGGQQADAAETSKLFQISDEQPTASQLLRGIAALASGDGRRLRGVVREATATGDPNVDYVERAADGLWSRLSSAVQMMSRNALGIDVDADPRALIDDVIDVLGRSSREVHTTDGDLTIRPALDGPYHLARLLAHVTDALLSTAVARLPAPSGVDDGRWRSFAGSFAERRPFLWRNHMSACAEGFLESGRSAVLTFPTGAGKTTITELRIAAELLRDRKVIYLAPTRALVDQVSSELQRTLVPIAEAVVRGRFLEDFGEQATGRVFVQTPEQCLAYLSFDQEAHTDIGLIVVDECHQLSGEPVRADGASGLPGRRAVDAMWTLLSLIRRSTEADVVLISAMVKNGAQLARWLKETTGRPASVLDLHWKPTRQVRGVVVYEGEEVDRLKQTIERRKQVRPGKKPRAADRRGVSAQPVGLFCHSQVWATESTFAKFPMLATPVPLSVNDYWGLTSNRNEVGGMLLGAMATARMRPIVFSQQISWTTNIADVGAKVLEAAGIPETTFTNEESALFDAAAIELGGPEHVEVPRNGRVGVHHGLLIGPERLAIESAFRRPDGLHALVATPTVAQGINLPAEAVIIAGDDRWAGDLDEGGMEPLAVHELLNAAGRAGRAGHYAHGIVIDLPGKVLQVRHSNDTYEVTGLDHIMSLFGLPDQCLDIVDPVTQILDRIQQAGLDAEVSEYFTRRTAGMDEQTLVSVLGTALGNVSMGRAEEHLAGQVALLKKAAIELDEAEQGEQTLDLEPWRELASQVGVPAVAVATAALRVPPPATVSSWQFRSFLEFVLQQVLEQLFSVVDPSSSGLARIIPRSRARRRDGSYEYTETHEQWQARWQAAAGSVLPLWISGTPIANIGAALHTARGATGRVNALHLGRRFGIHSVAAIAHGVSVVSRVVELTRKEDMRTILQVQAPLVPGCVREGFDDPDKLLLFWHLRRDAGRYPRVAVHAAFSQIAGSLPPWADGETVDDRRKAIASSWRSL